MVDKVEDVPGEKAQTDVPTSDIAAQPVIDAFGGIRPMAAKLDVPVSTVQGWKQRDTIPAGRIEAIVNAAREHGVALPALTEKAAPQPSQAESDAPARSTPPAGEHRPAGPRPAMQFSPPLHADAQEEPSQAAAPSETREAAAPRREPEHVPETSPSSATSTSRAPADSRTTTTPPADPPPSDTATSGAGRGAGGALFLAIIALIVAALWPILFSQWFGADAQVGGDGGTSALEQRVTALEEAPGAGSAELQQAVDALRAEVDGLSTGQGDGNAEVLQALNDRLDALEQSGVDGSAPAAEITQALDSLQQAMNRLDQLVGSLQTRVSSIEDQIAQIEAGGGGPTTDELQQALASVQAAVDQLQGNLDDVSQAADAAREQAVAEASTLVDQAVARLSNQIAAVAGTDDAAAEHQAFLLALGQLGNRLRTADAFADELAALRQVTASSESLSSLGGAVDQAFGTLDDAAAAGVPTLAGLRASFDSMRIAVLNARDTAPEDTLDEVWGEISSMVTVSRVDGAEAGTVDAILAAAEAHLAAGDLAAAVAALEGLAANGSGYAAAAGPWIADAKQRLVVDQAVESVYQAALTSFRPEPTPDTAPAPPGESE